MNRRRLVSLGSLLVVAFLGLGARLVYLQVFRHADLRARAMDNTQRAFYKEALRGDIRDSRGHILATSVKVKTICADPSLLGPQRVEMARILSPLLQLSDVHLLARFMATNSLGQVGSNQYVRLRHRVPEETWQQIEEVLHRQYTNSLRAAATQGRVPVAERRRLAGVWRRAIFAEDDQMRVYPNGQLASHVLGFAATEEVVVSGKRASVTVGREGIEATLNAKLSGSRGWRITETDSHHREMVAFREQDVDAYPGMNVVLTIDARVQQIVEEEIATAFSKHQPASVSAIVVRPSTGEILAMANVPTFDPNNLRGTPAAAMRNRAVTDIAEPGSTFKIVVVSAGLNEGVVKLHENFFCDHGRFWYAGRLLRDDHGGYGNLTVEGIITKSSNIGAAKIGLRLGEQRLYEYIRSFGFGTRTGIELTAEAPGVVHPLKDWQKLSISRIPMGHETAATPLQMIMAMSAIANGGTLMRPMIVNRLEDEVGHVVLQNRPQNVRRVLSEPVSRQMITALKTVCAPGGTAPKAVLENYTVAGKTGTAQKPPYHLGRHFSSFIGFFPADAPELCISVVVDDPQEGGYYGGLVAAPVFKRIAERAAHHMDIKPDILETKPETVARVSGLDAEALPAGGSFKRN